MPVTITAPRGLGRLSPLLRALITQVLRGEGRRVGEIAVVLSDDEMLRQINHDWRGIDRATDVISFAYDEREPDAATRAVRGDVLVSMDRVRDQARRFRITPGAELTRLVVHGTLHLCGHDHARAGERRLMRARETAALRAARGAPAALTVILGPSASEPARGATTHRRARPAARARRGK